MNRVFLKRVLISPTTILCFCLVGCGGEKLVPVSGTILLGGKPLPDAYVVFQPVVGDASEISSGKTNADGSYSLTSADGRTGCRVGEHKVLLTTVPPDAMADERTPLPKDKIPTRYQTEPLRFEVTEEGTDNARFELKR